MNNYNQYYSDEALRSKQIEDNDRELVIFENLSVYYNDIFNYAVFALI